MRKKHFLKLIAVAMAAVQIFALAGCGSKSTTDDSSKDDAAAEDSATKDTDKEESAESTGEVVELRFMDVQGSDERSAHFQEVVDAFNESHPNIKVTFESVPWDSAYKKLVTLGSAGDLPDVFINNPNWLVEFNDAGWMYPLDEFYEESGFGDKLIDYVNKVQKINEIDTYGHIVTMPYALGSITFMVRTDWLEEAGMTVEDLDTWDGIFEAAEKMTDASKNRYGFSFRGAQGGANHMHFYVLAVTGGKMYEDDGTCVYYRDDVKEAVARYADMYFKGYGPEDSVNWGFVETVQAFASGMTGMVFNNSDVMATFTDLDEDCWTSIRAPRAADGNIYAPGDYSEVSMASTTEHPEEAWEFMQFLLNDEFHAKYCKEFYMTPVTKSLSEDPEFSEGKIAGFVETTQDPNFCKTVSYGFFPEATEFETTIFDQEYQAYLIGQQTIEETCDNIADYLTAAQQAYMEENPDMRLPNAIIFED